MNVTKAIKNWFQSRNDNNESVGSCWNCRARGWDNTKNCACRFPDFAKDVRWSNFDRGRKYFDDIYSRKQNGYKNFDTMSGLEFEHYCAGVLENNGFTNVEVTQGSGDHGIDILAEKTI